MSGSILSVTELSNHIKRLLDGDAVLSRVSARGEISNYKQHSSGHHYMTLKDDGAVIAAVLFRGDASKLRFRPADGMKVVASGRVSSFPKNGQYQLYISDMLPDGVGALYAAFEQLKQKLGAEGLFDAAHKKPLPEYPRRVALVTSPTGAAVRDMTRILGHRFPRARVLVCPVTVQGPDAAATIADMIRYLNEHRLCDVMIVGRGGGGVEDLWAFNEEIVARAIFASGIPVISAVGHEPDVTIADFVADVRAATPSNAAEIAVPDTAELRIRLAGGLSRMAGALGRHIAEKRGRLDALSQKSVMSEPGRYFVERRMLLSLYEQRLHAAAGARLRSHRDAFIAAASKLDALSPLGVLSRGYSMASRQGEVVKSVQTLQKGDRLHVRFHDGAAECAVEEIKALEV